MTLALEKIFVFPADPDLARGELPSPSSLDQEYLAFIAELVGDNPAQVAADKPWD